MNHYHLAMRLRDLETWLCDQGDVVVRKESSGTALTEQERLLYEFWLFDAEQQNGGVSQYFCNHGLAQWDKLCAVAINGLPSFARFANAVSDVVGRSSDPYLSVIEATTNLDDVYDRSKTAMIEQLMAVCQAR
jgi:hypothetical protein